MRDGKTPVLEVWGETDDFYFHTACNHPILPQDEIIELIKRYRISGDKQARDRVVEHNVRLAASIAEQYRWSRLDLLDLIQYGVLGLFEAVDRFDFRPVKFSTYATYWVKRSIRLAIYAHRTTVRLPVHTWERSRLIARGTEISLSAKQIYRTHLAVRSVSRMVMLDEPDNLDTNRHGPGSRIADPQASPPERRLVIESLLHDAVNRLKRIARTAAMQSSPDSKALTLFRYCYGLHDGSYRFRHHSQIAGSLKLTSRQANQRLSSLIKKAGTSRKELCSLLYGITMARQFLEEMEP